MNFWKHTSVTRFKLSLSWQMQKSILVRLILVYLKRFLCVSLLTIILNINLEHLLKQKCMLFNSFHLWIKQILQLLIFIVSCLHWEVVRLTFQNSFWLIPLLLGNDVSAASTSVCYKASSTLNQNSIRMSILLKHLRLSKIV